MRIEGSRLLGVALGAAAAMTAVVPLLAHHSVAAQFDRSQQVTLTGAVARIEWINPHARFHMEVEDDSGATAAWEVELSASAMLIRRGWSRNDLKVGDVVTVNGLAAKDGSKLAYANSVTVSDGRRLFSGSADEQN
jgi:hypothetical protein